jgi:hypothetical protein
MCTAGYMDASEMLELFCKFSSPSHEKIEDNIFILFKIEDENHMNEIEKVLLEAEKNFDPTNISENDKLVVNQDWPLHLICQMIPDPPFGFVWKISVEQERSSVVFIKMLSNEDTKFLNTTLADIFSKVKNGEIENPA